MGEDGQIRLYLNAHRHKMQSGERRDMVELDNTTPMKGSAALVETLRPKLKNKSNTILRATFVLLPDPFILL